MSAAVGRGDCHAEALNAEPGCGDEGVQAAARGGTSGPRVALLTNFIPPYRAPLYRRVAAKLGGLQVLVSTDMEPNRQWVPDSRGLDVRRMGNLTLERKADHPHRFSETLYVHLPYSALLDLWRYRPDVVVSGQLGLASLLAALYCWLRPEAALLLWLTVSETSELGRGGLRRRLRRWIVARAAAAMVNGASGRRYVRSLGAADEQIFEVPYTADVKEFAARARAERAAPRRLLFVGSGEPRKGLAPFLSHLAAHARDNPDQTVELSIAGSGRDAAAEVADALPENLRVRWLGHIAYEDIPDVYAEAGILAFPTLADEWGLVVNEALAAGLPVLGSLYSQAVEELVEDERTGWTFRPDEASDCRSAIARALEASDEDLARMREACRERVAGLTFDAVADRMVAAITAAAEWNARPR